MAAEWPRVKCPECLDSWRVRIPDTADRVERQKIIDRALTLHFMVKHPQEGW